MRRMRRRSRHDRHLVQQIGCAVHVGYLPQFVLSDVGGMALNMMVWLAAVTLKDWLTVLFAGEPGHTSETPYLQSRSMRALTFIHLSLTSNELQIGMFGH